MAFKTQKTRCIEVLRPGFERSSDQIARRLKVSNSRVRYLVSDLRKDGYAIYLNRKNTPEGRVSVYRLGVPSRKMVALAVRLGGSALFTRSRTRS